MSAKPDKSYDTPPKSRSALEQRMRNILGADELQQRARRQLGYTAVAGCLANHAQDENGDPLFLIKGGVAIELRLGLAARATKDLDTAFRAPMDQMQETVREGLANRWDRFSFVLRDFEQIHTLDAWRVDVKVSFDGEPWSTVQLEVAAAEGEVGQQYETFSTSFVDPTRLGLGESGDMPLVTIAYLIAQKLHACTDHADAERENDRFRDLLDLLLVNELLTVDERPQVRGACVEIFKLRAKHDWPPSITVLPAWEGGFRTLANDLGFKPDDVHEAARQVDALIQEIDAAT